VSERGRMSAHPVLHIMNRIFIAIGLLLSALPAAGQTTPDIVSTREMERINWMEFREVVPARIQTVLLPTGTVEAHGVANNGADIMAPVAIARSIARRVNAMVAPAVPYGITGSLEAYAGGTHISESAYRPYVKEVIENLAKNGFRNIVVVNGHGGPQTAVLNAIAGEVAGERRVRTLVINWWSLVSEVTKEVFGEDGGHAGWNETAFMQAIDRTLVHPERYRDDLAMPRPAPDTWSAAPFPSSIILYQPGQGYPKFDQKKADEYFAKVTDRVAALITEIVRKWDLAGL